MISLALAAASGSIVSVPDVGQKGREQIGLLELGPADSATRPKGETSLRVVYPFVSSLRQKSCFIRLVSEHNSYGKVDRGSLQCVRTRAGIMPASEHQTTAFCHLSLGHPVLA
jgi:hypothetical protein